MGVFTPLQNAIRHNQERERQKKQDLKASFDSVFENAEQETIQDVLGNVNKDGGTQLGAEATAAVDNYYSQLNQSELGKALQAEADKKTQYDKSIGSTKGLPKLTFKDGKQLPETTPYTAFTEADKRVSEVKAKYNQAEGNYITKYDSNGNPIPFENTPEGSKYKELAKQFEDKLATANDAIVSAYNQSPDVLNTVLNPDAAEERLKNDLIRKGVSYEKASTIAKAELAPTRGTRDEGLIKSLEKALDREQGNTISITQGTSTGGTSTGGKTKGTKIPRYNPSKGAAEQLFVNSGIKAIKDEQAGYEVVDRVYTDDLDSVNEKVNKLRGTGASDDLIYEAMMNSTVGTGVKDGNKEFDVSKAAQYILDYQQGKNPQIIDNGNGAGAAKTYTQRAVKTRSPESTKAINALNSKLSKALQGTGRPPSKNEFLKAIFGNTKPETAITPPTKTETVENSKPEAFAEAPMIKAAMSVRTPGKLLEALTKNGGVDFLKEFDKLSDTEKKRVEKVFGTSPRAKLQEVFSPLDNVELSDNKEGLAADKIPSDTDITAYDEAVIAANKAFSDYKKTYNPDTATGDEVREYKRLKAEANKARKKSREAKHAKRVANTNETMSNIKEYITTPLKEFFKSDETKADKRDAQKAKVEAETEAKAVKTLKELLKRSGGDKNVVKKKIRSRQLLGRYTPAEAKRLLNALKNSK